MEGDCEFQWAAGSQNPTFQKESITGLSEGLAREGVKLEKPLWKG